LLFTITVDYAKVLKKTNKIFLIIYVNFAKERNFY